jgi:hypothetical protein
MSESINPFFTSGYASAAIAKLFAALPAPGTPPASSSSSCQSSPATSGNGATAGNSSVIPAANGTEPMASSTGPAEIETQTASFTTEAPSPTIHDLAIEEMELTGNNAGLARPGVGSSKFVDALMQLATGSDMALSIAARNLLPRLAGNGEYDSNGQAIVTYRYDPQNEDLTLNNLPDAAGFAAGDWWSDRAIANIASAMANGEEPDTADENFLRQRLFGSFSFTAADEVEANGANFYSVSAGSGYFDKQIINDHGIEVLPDCYVTATSATYGEF